jgi:hypothetical protein
MELTFSIAAWSAWAPGRTRPSDWQAWAREQHYVAEAGQPDIAFVPAMARRRLSSLSKMALASAAACTAALDVAPTCIFASRHGELARTLKIIDSMVRAEDVSPADFSMSVFNTALGLFSIVTANQGASTMVVGAEDTFGSALIEAHLHLARFPATPVLLVFFDEPLPEPLNELEQPPGEAFSLALLLAADGKPNVAVQRAANPDRTCDPLNPGLAFLKFWLSGKSAGSVTTPRSTWQWSRL